MAERRLNPLPYIFLLYLAIQTLTPRPRDRFDDHPSLEDAVSQEHTNLAAIANSSWDPDFGRQGHTLNITGLEPGRGYAWDALSRVKSRAREQLEYALGEWGTLALDGRSESPNPTALYTNVSGKVQGKWKRSKLQEEVILPQLNLSAYAPPQPFGQRVPPRPFSRNITGEGGHVTVHFEEDSLALDSNSTTEMTVMLTLTDAVSYDEWDVRLRGVYSKDLGQAILTTTSPKFAGIFILPHLALSPMTFESSRALLNSSISRTIQRQSNGATSRLNPWTAKLEGGEEFYDNPKCDMVVYLQQMAPIAAGAYSTAFLSFVESELRFPTGAIVPDAPDLHFSMLLFSPDCGFVLESSGPPEDIAQNGHHLNGQKYEVQQKHWRRHLVSFTLALALQLVLLTRQMRDASTPSTRSRISYYTIMMLALGDGFMTMAFLMLSLYLQGVWVILVGTAFLAFIGVAFFAMRFINDIWQVQAPERERIVRAEVEEDQQREQRFHEALQRIRAERLARQNAESAAVVNSNPLPDGSEPNPPPTDDESVEPPPTTASHLPVDTGATPFFMPSDQEGLLPISNEPPTQRSTEALVAARMPTFGALYTRFYLVLLATIFSSSFALSWVPPARHIFYTMLGLGYLSFWVPQIARNVQRNCRHALKWEFVIGQSVLRLVPYSYFYAYKHNVIQAEPDFYGLACLVAWVWIQVVLLGSQELIGPRWFIRSGWAPPAYDYHPILREDEEGATMPIGLSQDAAQASVPSSPSRESASSSPMLPRRASIPKESKDKGKRLFDCAICMQELEVPVIPAGAPGDTGLGANLLARRNYMVTPCRHIFHSVCLEGWMKYRLQCPNCRETLPPL